MKKITILTIVLGIIFRFYNLDRKVYWYDETMTSLRISGYVKGELVNLAYTGKPISVETFRNTYQFPNPSRDLEDSIAALAKHPEHSPLYYLIARFWLQVFPPSVTSIRSLSVALGLLVLPSAYWLAKELFTNPIAPSSIVAVMAISPFHILYAQEAREYSLWTVAILVSCAAFLRALRISQTQQEARFYSLISSWGLYAITVALNLYAHPFAAFVSIGHGIYVAIEVGWKQKKIVLAYILASIAGLLLFIPWLQIVVANFSNFVDNTISTTNPRSNLHLIWGLNLSRIFFDVNQGTSLLNPLLYIIIGLVGYGIYFLCRNARSQTWLFILLLMGVTGLALIGPDILVGGRRSNNLRYAVPCVLGIQLVITYLFATKLSTTPRQTLSWKYWKLGIISLFFVSLVSVTVSSQVEVWWHKSPAKSRYNPAISRIINQAESAIVISDEVPGRLLSFSHLLDRDVTLLLIGEGSAPMRVDEFKNIYLYRPSEALKQQIEEIQGQKLNRAYKRWLWQLDGELLP
ncbi:MAG: glycosyltransferase family 39 protein [Cyanobacteriota bacterium]|nr:glycosyltransferase family 39 protein [Cyanobacteriota bacterium]